MTFWKDLHSREWIVIENSEMNDIQGTGEATASGRNIEALRIAFNLGLIELSTLYAHQWVDNCMIYFFFFAWGILNSALRYQVAKGGKNTSQFLSHPPPHKTVSYYLLIVEWFIMNTFYSLSKIIILLGKKKLILSRQGALLWLGLLFSPSFAESQ